MKYKAWEIYWHFGLKSGRKTIWALSEGQARIRFREMYWLRLIERIIGPIPVEKVQQDWER